MDTAPGKLHRRSVAVELAGACARGFAHAAVSWRSVVAGPVRAMAGAGRGSAICYLCFLSYRCLMSLFSPHKSGRSKHDCFSCGDAVSTARPATASEMDRDPIGFIGLYLFEIRIAVERRPYNGLVRLRSFTQ